MQQDSLTVHCLHSKVLYNSLQFYSQILHISENSDTIPGETSAWDPVTCKKPGKPGFQPELKQPIFRGLSTLHSDYMYHVYFEKTNKMVLMLKVLGVNKH